MKALLRLLLVVLALVGGPVLAQDAGGGNAYTIGGIDVDVAGPNPETARLAAYRIAQRKAWPLLWARLTGSPAGAAPHLSDGQLDGMVSGIESQGERFSMTRYIARLGVIFDRSRASDYFGGTMGGRLQSPPMLLLPVYTDGGVRTLYQAKTPWRAAWQRFRENVTPIDYVVASGSAGDNVVLTGWQVTRPDRPTWRNILNRFDAVDVLSAEARLVRSYPGGPIRALFIARHGPDATELGRFELGAASDDGLDAMLDTAVRQVDEIYANALRDGQLRSEADLTADLNPIIAEAPAIGIALESGEDDAAGATSTSVEAVMATPDAATASALESQLRGTRGVTGVTITSLSLGGTSRLLIGYAGSRESLAYALDGRGLRLAAENGETVLRRRREGDVAIAPPAGTPPASPGPTPALPPESPLMPVAEPARRSRSVTPPGDATAPGPARTPEKPGDKRPVDLMPNGA